MSQTTISQFEFFGSTTNTVLEIFKSVSKTKVTSAATRQPKSKVVVLKPKTEAAAPSSFSSVDDFVSDLIKSNPGFAEKLSESRKSLALLETSKASTLKSKRLLLGMSQKDLALAIGTTQPHIARIEKNPSCMMFDTAFRISNALGIEMSELAELAGLGLNRTDAV